MRLREVEEKAFEDPETRIVVNMSWGTSTYHSTLEKACQRLAALGVILVAAVGNDGLPTRNYPAAFECVIGVGSVDAAGDRFSFVFRDHTKTDFTNYGNCVEVVAVVPESIPDDLRSLFLRPL